MCIQQITVFRIDVAILTTLKYILLSLYYLMIIEYVTITYGKSKESTMY